MPWATSRIVYKLHKLRVAVSTSLERSSVLNQIPEETSLHACIALANDINLGTDDERISVVFAQSLYY